MTLMFTAPRRPLPFPLDRAVQLTVTTPAGEEVCGLPEFPEDSDEKITVLFRLSLNEFVALATAVDVGCDPAFGADAQKVWWLWTASVMCAAFCEEVAQCLLDENPVVVEALAQLIRNNPTISSALNDQRLENGGGSPGQEVSEEAANQDLLPENTKNPDDTCDLDALWGGMLYLVQSGNRSIVDFLETIEVASNALEAMAISAGAIPAAGNSVSAGFEFANALQEFFAENYAANYTEGYEQSLACDLFCAARGDCNLSIDDMINTINARFVEPFDVVTFAAIMVRMGTATIPGNFVGTAICDAMFLLYFTALKFGQQFGDVIGLRPLPVIISLGADQLASDNWEVLCDCPECGIEFTIDIGTEGMDGDIVSAATALVTRLDIPPATAYGRRIQVTFASPVTEVTLGWNTEGALDDMFASLDGSAAQTLATPAGSTTLIFPAGTVLTVDLGYSGDSGAYASNPARINITDACE